MKKEKRKISLGLPIWIEAMFPQKVLKKIREQSESAGVEEILKKHNVMLSAAEQKYEESRYKAEVYLHLSDDRRSRFGHMDFAFGRLVYSYGCYDEKSNRLFNAISDGVLVITPREKYIDYCLAQENKVLIGYPLLLTAEQEKLMVKTLRDFRHSVKKWHPNSYYYGRGEKIDISDAASKLQMACGAHFYKVRQNRFKTYFVFGANCALLVDECIGLLGAERITPRIGIISPGACYRYFETALLRRKSFVAGRKIYISKK